MKVLKFGGTSLGDASRMRQVALLAGQEQECVVVCSAMAGVTNTLADIVNLWSLGKTERAGSLLQDLYMQFSSTCYELFPDLEMASASLRMIEGYFAVIRARIGTAFSSGLESWILSQGEIITSHLLADYMNANGWKIQLLNALKFMRLQANGEPSVTAIQSALHHSYGSLDRGRYITQGFICLDHNGQAATLQRGGSDYTATLIGAALTASAIEIWTDIDGVRNNDPRFVDNTFAIRELSYAEAAELAYFGAKILHPSCVWPASSNTIPIYLKNTLQPSSPGTIIRENVKSSGIRAVAAKGGISIIRIRSGRMLNAYGFLRRVFEIFEIYKTPIDVITTSEVAVSVSIDVPLNLDPICEALAGLGEVSVERDQAIVCIVGDILAEHQGYAACILESLKHLHVKMVSYGGSKNNLSLVLPEKEKRAALLALQKSLFMSAPVSGLQVADQPLFSN